jgi:hypothetical protein
MPAAVKLIGPSSAFDQIKRLTPTTPHSNLDRMGVPRGSIQSLRVLRGNTFTAAMQRGCKRDRTGLADGQKSGDQPHVPDDVPPPPVPPMPGEGPTRMGLTIKSTSTISGVTSHICSGSLARFSGCAIAVQMDPQGGTVSAVGHAVLPAASTHLIDQFNDFKTVIRTDSTPCSLARVVRPRGGRIAARQVVLASIPRHADTPAGFRRSLERSLKAIFRAVGEMKLLHIAIEVVESNHAAATTEPSRDLSANLAALRAALLTCRGSITAVYVVTKETTVVPPNPFAPVPPFTRITRMGDIGEASAAVEQTAERADIKAAAAGCRRGICDQPVLCPACKLARGVMVSTTSVEDQCALLKDIRGYAQTDDSVGTFPPWLVSIITAVVTRRTPHMDVICPQCALVSPVAKAIWAAAEFKLRAFREPASEQPRCAHKRLVRREATHFRPPGGTPRLWLVQCFSHHAHSQLALLRRSGEPFCLVTHRYVADVLPITANETRWTQCVYPSRPLQVIPPSGVALAHAVPIVLITGGLRLPGQQLFTGQGLFFWGVDGSDKMVTRHDFMRRTRASPPPVNLPAKATVLIQPEDVVADSTADFVSECAGLDHIASVALVAARISVDSGASAAALSWTCGMLSAGPGNRCILALLNLLALIYSARPKLLAGVVDAVLSILQSSVTPEGLVAKGKIPSRCRFVFAAPFAAEPTRTKLALTTGINRVTVGDARVGRALAVLCGTWASGTITAPLDPGLWESVMDNLDARPLPDVLSEFAGTPVSIRKGIVEWTIGPPGLTRDGTHPWTEQAGHRLMSWNGRGLNARIADGGLYRARRVQIDLTPKMNHKSLIHK